MVKVIVRNFFGKRFHNCPLENPPNLFSEEPPTTSQGETLTPILTA
jgi:hypothetical protein